MTSYLVCSMDKITKALRKLSPKQRTIIVAILSDLKQGKTRGLDIQRLQGHRDIYRVRKGDMRIIYRQTSSKIMILALEKRSERTYNGL